MCGIVGVLERSQRPVSPVLLRRMTDAVAHRGPDGEGSYIDGNLGLGHRRLAILDLSPAGHQPMALPGGDLVITYNGEVYNFHELRAELEALGHTFHTRTDTEVVLHAYAEWGADAVRRLNGMFAFAVWDTRHRRLFLARDRYGVKPLYWAHADGAFLFGSEIKALLCHPSLKAGVSHPHLLEYFTFQNILSDGTLFRWVRHLPAGHHLTVEADRPPPAPVRYWDFVFAEPERPLGREEYREELDRLFQQAVHRQLVSDAPVGAFLSGGMDSGSITAIATRSIPELKTFTCGFDLTSASGMEMNFDERHKAEALSYRFRTEHYEVVLKAGDMERCLPSVVWHLEDLRVGQCYPNYCVSRLAGKFVKSILSGIGGDELFAGYPWRYYRAVVNDDFDDYVGKYFRFWHRLLPSEVMPDLFVPEVWREVREVSTLDLFRGVLEGGSSAAPRTPEDYVNRSLYFEAKVFLHGLLVVEDRLSMAHGLETRVPFLDNDLVDFAVRVPVAHKLRDLSEVVRLNENEPGPKTQVYFQATRDGKLLLRDVMGRYVPEEVTNQVKQGFSGPDAAWFKGDSMDYVRRIVWDDRARIFDYLQPRTVRGLVEEHLSGRQNRRLLIWSLLCFEWWLRRFLPT